MMIWYMIWMKTDTATISYWTTFIYWNVYIIYINQQQCCYKLFMGSTIIIWMCNRLKCSWHSANITKLRVLTFHSFYFLYRALIALSVSFISTKTSTSRKFKLSTRLFYVKYRCQCYVRKWDASKCYSLCWQLWNKWTKLI